MAVGRNFDEILRVIDALQIGDKHGIATPVNWRPAQITARIVVCQTYSS